MAPPRLKGTSLTLVRNLARSRSVARLLFAQNAADFRMNEMLALPASARADVDVEPRPVQGAPVRRWEQGDLPPPRTSRGTGEDLRAAYASGATDPAEVLSRIVGRIGAADFALATHSPFVCLALDEARRAAEQSAARWHEGHPLGPLDGMPVPVKDELDLAGLPTTGGTAYRTEPASADSWVVRRLRQAGAVVFGKTHTTEWGMNPWGMNPHYPMPRNAFSSGHGAGGSSTGTAAAVAMGLCPAGVGSDGGGSIRVPAALNGLFGLKPTFSRVGRTGDIFDPSTTVAHLGPIGRSTADLVDLLSAIGGSRDPGDPMTGYAPEGDPSGSWREALGRGVKGCRIGVPEAEWADADPGVVAPARAALSALEAEGARLVDISVPNAQLAGAAGALQIIVETYGGVMDDFAAHGESMGMDLQLLLSLVEVVTAADYLAAQRTRARFRRTTAAAIAGVDVLALPTTQSTAPAYPLSETGIAVSDTAATQRMTRFVWLGNITGLPAGTVPVGMHDGLPVGLQIVGDAWDEASVVAVLAHVERLGISALSAPSGWRSLVG